MGGRLGLLAALLVAGCAPAARIEPSFTPTASAPSSAGPYRLGPGDRVRVIVYGEPSLSNDFAVSDGGVIAFPLIGAVKAEGRTAAEVQSALQTRLAGGYLRDPKVAVEIAAYRPFYILGEVQRPGRYPWTGGLTLTAAVATAGGFTYRAQTRRIVVQHAGGGAESKTPGAFVEPGDIITVKERFF